MIYNNNNNIQIPIPQYIKMTELILKQSENYNAINCNQHQAQTVSQSNSSSTEICQTNNIAQNTHNQISIQDIPISKDNQQMNADARTCDDQQPTKADQDTVFVINTNNENNQHNQNQIQQNMLQIDNSHNAQVVQEQNNIQNSQIHNHLPILQSPQYKQYGSAMRYKQKFDNRIKQIKNNSNQNIQNLNIIEQSNGMQQLENLVLRKNNLQQYQFIPENKYQMSRFYIQQQIGNQEKEDQYSVEAQFRQNLHRYKQDIDIKKHQETAVQKIKNQYNVKFVSYDQSNEYLNSEIRKLNQNTVAKLELQK